MNISFRRFDKSQRDYEIMANIFSEVSPHNPQTPGDLKFEDDNFNPKYEWHRFMIEHDGEVIGYTDYEEPYWSYEPGKYWIDCKVRPKYQSNGIGAQSFEFIMNQLESKNPTKLVAITREDRESAMHFLKQRGFEQTMRFPTSELELEGFDPTPFDSLIAKLESEGIQFLTFPDLKEHDANWKPKLHELRWEILADVPSPDPLTKDTIERWEQEVLQNPRLLPEGWIIAVDGDDFVGYSNLWKLPAKPEKLDTGLTGVVRSHRRRGICTAMKVKAFSSARAAGATLIETENEENNPMYQINMTLGFKPQPAWLDFQKHIVSENGDGS